LGLLAAGGALAAARQGPRPKLKKAVKYGMIRTRGTIEDKFNLIKKLGFQGVELDSPSRIDRGEAVRARDATGIVIHGVVDSVHWTTRLSDPDPEVRARGLEALKTALGDCKFYGGDTVLLVPGAVRDPKHENYEQVWERSTAEVKKALPTAEKAGVKIAVEVVWNNFLTKPGQLVDYVDQFKSPLVGAYFDCSNMLKYGVSSADWIRQLGKRMLKFDFKGYSIAKAKAAKNEGEGFKVGIGEGDEDWPEVLKALAEVGYHGWATAEVGGGGESVLKDISERMDRVLGLS
jgi:hexulose-6-phosphate isomerase